MHLSPTLHFLVVGCSSSGLFCSPSLLLRNLPIFHIPSYRLLHWQLHPIFSWQQYLHTLTRNEEVVWSANISEARYSEGISTTAACTVWQVEDLFAVMCECVSVYMCTYACIWFFTLGNDLFPSWSSSYLILTGVRRCFEGVESGVVLVSLVTVVVVCSVCCFLMRGSVGIVVWWCLAMVVRVRLWELMTAVGELRVVVLWNVGQERYKITRRNCATPLTQRIHMHRKGQPSSCQTGVAQ